MNPKYKPQKATGASVSEFYDLQDQAMAEPSTGKRTNRLRYSCLVLARVEPMPSFEEFEGMLDDEINSLVDECKKLNPRHFAEIKAEELDEKKKES